MSRSLCGLLISLYLPALALAHEGHGHTESSSPIHYVVEPVHALQLIGLALLVPVVFVLVSFVRAQYREIRQKMWGQKN